MCFVNQRRLAPLFAAALLALFSAMPVMAVKYVAVVEGDIDEASGAAEKVSRSDIRLVTAEVRREAVKNLPSKNYVVMTSETIMAQGGAVLEACAGENCAVALGSKIGADYIVRATVSKLESKFTLQVEMYETNAGVLETSCDPVRSESIAELVAKAAEVCANMFKTWAASKEEGQTDNVLDNRNKFDYYFAVKGYNAAGYGLWGLRLEWVCLTDDGGLHSSEFNIGIGQFGLYTKDGDQYNMEEDMGFGYSYGRELCFDNNLQLQFGGSVGVWYGFNFTYYDTNIPKPMMINKEKVYARLKMYVGFGGPFVRVHWQSIELGYRLLMGISTDYYIVESSTPDTLMDSFGFGVSHQISVGYDFGKNPK